MEPTAALLAQLEPLPYPDRMTALARWARGPADVPRVVAELSTGSRYERFLAVTATVISGGDVTPFRHDPDGSIRAVAVKHLLRTGRLTGDDLITLVADAPAALRALIYRTARTARLTAAADGLIDPRARPLRRPGGRAVAPGLLPALLGGILFARGKVTSRKETARLLAAYGPPEAMRTLLDAYRQDGQHRDVRAAIVGAARDRPHTPAGWEILATAAAGTREDRMAVLATTPAGRPVAGRQRAVLRDRLRDAGRAGRDPDARSAGARRAAADPRAADRLAARVARERESLDPAILIAAARSLRLRGDLVGGLLALALVRAGESYGWSAVWRDLLRGLREHPDGDVRDEAYAVSMA